MQDTCAEQSFIGFLTILAMKADPFHMISTLPFSNSHHNSGRCPGTKHLTSTELRAMPKYSIGFIHWTVNINT